MLGNRNFYKSCSNSNARFEMNFGLKYKDYIKNPLKKVEIKNKVYINYKLKTRFLQSFYKLF